MAGVLIVGGTGPTGPGIVDRFLAAGHDVAIYHTGAHEAEFAGEVEHLHGDPRDPADIAAKLGAREWDIAVCTSGRLRSLAETLAGRTGRLVGVTGQPVYRHTMQRTPSGRLVMPVPEFAERQRDAANYTGKVADGEDQLFAQHGRGDFEVSIVRYPGVYGPRAPIAHEWAIVRRILDGRPFAILPHDGITYFQRGFADNVAHLVFLAATRPEAAGHAFNSGDERVMSARHVAQVIAEELGSGIEFVGVPAQYCRGVYPLAEKSDLILDMSKPRLLLGYRDPTEVEEATRLTARWLAENPPRPEDVGLAGAGMFDYDREDRIVAAWRRAEQELAPLMEAHA